MIGDRLVITDYHRMAAEMIMDSIREKIGDSILVISIAGESGSGKSETAACLAEEVEKLGFRYFIIGQDDYFKLPPKSNHQKRMEDIGWVGPQEVQLDLMDRHIAALRKAPSARIEKPLVYFKEDRIGSEEIPLGLYDVIIAEGTYTTLLKNLDLRAFIDRDYRETKKARLERNRDTDSDFIGKVLEIEHRIISEQKSMADVVIPPSDVMD